MEGTAIWELDLEPNAKPVVMQPGGCLKFGESLDGYKLDGDLGRAGLRSNFTYNFYIARLNDSEHYNHFYDATFCVLEDEGGGDSILSTPGRLKKGR